MWDNIVSIGNTTFERLVVVLGEVYASHPAICGSVVGALSVLVLLFVIEMLKGGTHKVEAADRRKDGQGFRLRR